MSSVPAFLPNEFEEATRYDSIILDARDANNFMRGYVPGSVYLYHGFWNEKFLAKTVTENKEEFYLVADEHKWAELAKWIKEQSGNEIKGILEGGFVAWEAAGKQIDMIISIEPDEIMMDMKYSKPQIVDVRSKTAYELMHLEGADHVNPEQLLKNASKVKEDQTFYLYCEDGQFSLSLISLLKREGHHNFYHLQGGFRALNAAEATMVKGG